MQRCLAPIFISSKTNSTEIQSLVGLSFHALPVLLWIDRSGIAGSNSKCTYEVFHRVSMF